MAWIIGGTTILPIGYAITTADTTRSIQALVDRFVKKVLMISSEGLYVPGLKKVPRGRQPA
jgi:hypothetical protein